MTVKDLSVFVNTGSATTIIVEPYPAGGILSALRVVRAVAGELVYADASVSPFAIGIITESAGIGGFPPIIVGGIVEDASWNWDLTAPVFLGNSGSLIQPPIAITGWLVQIAQPLSPTSLLVNIQEPMLL